MSRRLLVGPLMLLAWQIAPITATHDSSGRYRVTLGYGGGQLETRTLNCAGEVVSAAPQSFTFGAAEVEAWPTDRLRLSAAGTIARAEVGGWLPGATPPTETTDFPRVTTTTLGGLVAYEGGVLGVGLGVSTVGNWWRVGAGDDTPQVLPAFYFRLGSRERAQFRLDVLTPTVYVPVSGVVRTGVSWGRGIERRMTGFVGVSFGPQADEAYPLGGFLEMGIPLAGRLDATFAGAYRPSYTFTDWGAAVGLRLNLGR